MFVFFLCQNHLLWSTHDRVRLNIMFWAHLRGAFLVWKSLRNIIISTISLLNDYDCLELYLRFDLGKEEQFGLILAWQNSEIWQEQSYPVKKLSMVHKALLGTTYLIKVVSSLGLEHTTHLWCFDVFGTKQRFVFIGNYQLRVDIKNFSILSLYLSN